MCGVASDATNSNVKVTVTIYSNKSSAFVSRNQLILNTCFNYATHPRNFIGVEYRVVFSRVVFKNKLITFGVPFHATQECDKCSYFHVNQHRAHHILV
jgi:hypothetical protein